MAKTTPPTKGAAEPKGKAKDKDGEAKPARRSKFAELYPEDTKVTVLVEENPKKAGSASRERFEHYFKAKTVGDFLAAGGTYADVAYDVGRAHIKVG